jgi:signal transduction histidine kinase
VERKQEQVLEQERLARIEAERADRLKLRFLGMISHELRTPLASIKGFTTTLLATDVKFPPEDQNYFLSIVNIEADRLHNLIEHLLDLSSLEAGMLSIYPEAQTLSAILDQARAQLDTLTGEHRFFINLRGVLPDVYADSQRIVQVVVNLVGNAVKYCPPGTQIMVEARLEGAFVRVDISDHGPGIPLELRPYVFEAFRRVEDRSLRLKGAGLGLAICKGLIENHKGNIWIDDTYTAGTRMSFTLPAVIST